MGGGEVSLGFLVGFWEGWIGRGGDVPKASMASGMVLKAGFCYLEVPFGCCCCSEGAIAAVELLGVLCCWTESVVCLYVKIRAVVVSSVSVSLLNQVQIQSRRANATKQASRMGLSSSLSLCIAYSSRGWRYC